MRLRLLRIAHCGAAILLLSLSASRSTAADNVADLLGWVPARTNFVVFVDSDKLMASEAAKKGKWGTHKHPTVDITSLPPGVSRFVLAADYAPGAGLNWEVLVVGLRKKITDEELLAGTGGRKDTIAERTVAITPRHGYAANLAPGVVGAYQPPNRQETARWLKAANGKANANLSPFIKQAAAGVATNSPIVLAIDTTDMFDPTVMEAKLNASTTFKGKAALVKPIAKLFSEMQGVTITVRTTDKISCRIALDFASPTDSFKTVAKPMMLEVFDKLGVHCDEMDGWTATVAGNSVSLSGDLTVDSLRELTAPFIRGSVSNLDQTEHPAMPPADMKAQKSLSYYKAVHAKMSEVRKSSNPTFQKLAMTFNAAARAIDDLPILNVDEELLNWGQSIATTFRTMAIVAQTAGGQMTLAEANKSMAVVSTPNYYTGSYGGAVNGYYGGAAWGGTYAVPSGTTSMATIDNYGQVANFQFQTKEQEADYRRNTWKNMDTATNDIRRKMVKKYEIEF